LQKEERKGGHEGREERKKEDEGMKTKEGSKESTPRSVASWDILEAAFDERTEERICRW
jgi:hypothetical protein